MQWTISSPIIEVLNNLMKKPVCIVIFFLIVLIIACGDIWESRRNIYGKYYLVERDTKDNISICYKTRDGDYIVRVPSKVKEYAILGDSLIVAKTLDATAIKYYILKMKNDSDYSEKEQFLTGPLDEGEVLSIIGYQPQFVKAEKD